MLGTSPPTNDNHSNAVPTSNSIPEFVKKLFGMLEDNTYPQIFSWGKEGDTFVVKDPNEFARHILPKHFKHSNFASFVRQLNKYDFHKLRMPEDGQRIYGDQAWEFQHPNFKYNRRELLEDIKRKPTGKAAQANQSLQTQSTTSNTSNTSIEEELKNIANNLQKEISGLKDTQKKMTDKVKSFDKKYSVVLDNIQGFKKNMEDQDVLMREIMTFISKNSTSYTTEQQEIENIMNSYNNVATTGEAQLDRLAEVIGAPISMNNTSVNESNMNNMQQQQAQQQQAQAQQQQAQAQAQAQQQQQQAQQQQQQAQQQQQQQQQQQAQQQQQQIQQQIINSNNNTTSMIPVIHASSGTVTPSRKRKRIQVGWTVPPRVLLVDDDSIFRRLSTKLLQIAGCTIDVAVDGMEAVRKLGTGKYDLVLMDIMMPKLDGMSATRNIRQYDTWTPIISMTSNTTDQDIQQYFLSGMTDVLPKPLNQGTLGNLLERYCAHLVVQRQQQQQLQLLQQNYSLNGSLINLNNLTPQLTLIEDEQQQRQDNKGKGKELMYTSNNIPQLQLQQPPQYATDQQPWYLYVNEKRPKIEQENSL